MDYVMAFGYIDPCFKTYEGSYSSGGVDWNALFAPAALEGKHAMKTYHHYWTLLIAGAVSMMGCTNTPTSPETLSQSLYGQVVDAQGNALVDVGVHYIFQIPGSSSGKIEGLGSVLPKICPTTSIMFSVPTKTKVTLKIVRWYTRDSIATLVDDTLGAGTHSVVFNASALTNGLYLYQLKMDTTLTEKLMVLLNSDLSTLLATTPLTKSNASGAFELPYALLGFGVPFTRTTVGGSTVDTVQILPTIQIVLCKTGYSTATQSVTIDPAVGVRQRFVLNRQ